MFKKNKTRLVEIGFMISNFNPVKFVNRFFYK